GKTQYYMRAIIQFIFAYWARNEDGTGLIFSSDIKSMSTEDPKGKAYKASVGLTQAWIMHDCKIRNESCPPLLGGVGSLKTEIQKRLSAQMKKPDPFRDDTTDGAKQWAQFHETGDQKTDDTATSPGEKRKQANKENKPEPSKVDLKRKKSGLPEVLSITEQYYHRATQRLWHALEPTAQ
ncbi:hypothetical protein WJX77_001745, partial [Trebouxia sp. C0004]